MNFNVRLTNGLHHKYPESKNARFKKLKHNEKPMGNMGYKSIPYFRERHAVQRDDTNKATLMGQLLLNDIPLILRRLTQ